MDLTSLVTQGNANPLLLGAIAFALGALHGLEPGHSKTMIAAFVIAMRGTVGQSVLLGLSAALSHSLIVWILAYVGLSFDEEMEGRFMLTSGLIIVVLAGWIYLQTRRANRDGQRGHSHTHDQDHAHAHDHIHKDVHARAHAKDIEERFSGASATTGQVVLFGLTGGLLPCAAAVTVLIICLHLDKLSLGLGLVASFSIGLAMVLVAVGVVAALGTAYAARRSRRFDRLFAKALYLSAAVMALIGIGMAVSSFNHLHA